MTKAGGVKILQRSGDKAAEVETYKITKEADKTRDTQKNVKQMESEKATHMEGVSLDIVQEKTDKT